MDVSGQIVGVLSGGNIDPALFAILAEPDDPGFVPPQTPLLVVRAGADHNWRAAVTRPGCGCAHGKTHKCSTSAGCRSRGRGRPLRTDGRQAEAFVRRHPLVTASRLGRMSGRPGEVRRLVSDDTARSRGWARGARAAGVTLDCVIDIDPGTTAPAHPRGRALAASRRRRAWRQAAPPQPATCNTGGHQRPSVAGGRTWRPAWSPAAARALTPGTSIPRSLNQAGSYAVWMSSTRPVRAAGRSSRRVAASVVSANHKSHVTVDAASGLLQRRPALVPGRGRRRLAAMGDEHGASGLPALKSGDFITVADASTRPAAPPACGRPATRRLQPGHCTRPSTSMRSA
jgi:hypothetical protein